MSILAGVLEDPAVHAALHLIEEVECRYRHPDPTYAGLYQMLAESAELSDQPIVGSAWQNRLLDALLDDDNVFVRKAESAGIDSMGKSLTEQMRTDLAALRALHDLPIDDILSGFPPLTGFQPMHCSHVNEPRLHLKRQLHECDDWRECVALLAEFYTANGAGDFGNYRAFRWMRGQDGGTLRPVVSPDPITLEDLVEYDWQREAVRRNTTKLLKGLPANNMLLYGDRGTGKSSTVKAMLNQFARERLRLVEVAKEDLIDLPEILSILRKRPEKFILFIDDL